jgi:cobalt-zinc-cadmium efflux system outer membrane protein
MSSFTIIRRCAIVAIVTGLAGCTVHPPGEAGERAAAFRSGKSFERRFEVREVPALPANPTPDQLVEFALLNNAGLEQQYWTWRAAIEQIPQDGTQTTTLNIAAGTNITNGRASWGSSTVALSNDPMTDIKWPGKLDTAAKQTLETARAAGRRFLKAKYDIRNKVLSAYYDYALSAALIRLEESSERLLEITANTTAARNRSGAAGQQDVMKANNELDLARNDIAIMRSQLPGQRASINALLNRPPDAALPEPATQPPERPMTYQDDELVELAANRNPELIALADEIRGRQDGIRLAQLQYVPDFNLSVGTDLMGITQSVLGQATIPIFRYEALNAAIAQAQANLRASEAMRRQTGSDLAAQVISDITFIRDADRQLDLFEHTILPRARQIVEIGRSAYETGHASLLDLLDGQRSLIAIEQLVASLRNAREKHLVDLEAITATPLSTVN